MDETRNTATACPCGGLPAHPTYGDHPHIDPGDGRTECPDCGKWVHRVIHSCKRFPVTGAAQARTQAVAHDFEPGPVDEAICNEPSCYTPDDPYGFPHGRTRR